MKRITQAVTRTVALSALAMACASALAQPHGPDRHGGRGPQMHRSGPHGPQMGRPGPYRAPQGYPEYRRFQRGDRLPAEYRRPQYVVNDWRAYGLRQPPRGYYWVQNGSDYVLAAVATGVISAVVINALTQ